jgi:putative Holliday junction resolvase
VTSPAPRGVLLGIDHGDKVIGLALCDSSWIVARPLQQLKRTSREADFARIKALLERHHVQGVVVGLPATPEDFDGVSQANTVHRWVMRLAAAVNVPVYLWDEGLSTFVAEQLSLETRIALPDRIDDRAAAVILQSFIDAHPAGTALPDPVRR